MMYLSSFGSIDAQALHDAQDLFVVLRVARRGGRRHDDGNIELHPSMSLDLTYAIAFGRIQYEHLAY